MRRLFLFLCSALIYLPSLAHVALIYPPAQTVNDFLDNTRTPAPCGTGPLQLITDTSGQRRKTSILSDTTFTVRWHVGYAHFGGVSIQVINTTAGADGVFATLATVYGEAPADPTRPCNQYNQPCSSPSAAAEPEPEGESASEPEPEGGSSLLPPSPFPSPPPSPFPSPPTGRRLAEAPPPSPYDAACA